MVLHIPELFALVIIELLLLLGWLAWRASPARRRKIRPYRQGRRALVVLEPGEVSSLVQRQLSAHVIAARNAGLEVIGVESEEQSGSSEGAARKVRALDFSGQAAALPMFCADSLDAFECEEFEAFLLALKINELYLAGGGPALDVHLTARSAMERGYRVSVLVNAIDVYGDPTEVPVERAMHYAAG